MDLSRQVIINYKKFDINKFDILHPKKVNGSNICELLYDSNHTVMIQTPDIIFTENNLLFNIAKKGQFYTLLEDINNRIISILSDRSSDFFNGKEFSKEQIKSAVIPFYNLEESGDVIMSLPEISKDIKIFDYFKNPVDKTTDEIIKSDVYMNCIINLKRLRFIKNKIYIDIILTHVKYSNIKKGLNKKCVLGEKPRVDTNSDYFFE